MRTLTADDDSAECSQRIREIRRIPIQDLARRLITAIIPARCSLPHGYFRLLPLCITFAVMLCLVLPLTAFGAELRWQALPDRERISIRLNDDEGAAGHAARVTPTTVHIPFTRVPPALAVKSAPEGAKIFAGSSAEGGSLILHTQDPAFGFLVSKAEPRELVVDFFPNPLGTRWKPSHSAPAPEPAPGADVEKSSPPGNNQPPSDKEIRPTVSEQQKAVSGKAATQSQAERGKITAEQQQGSQHTAETDATTATTFRGKVRAGQERPAVVSLTGSPLHATQPATPAEPPSEKNPGGQPGLVKNTGTIADGNSTQRQRDANTPPSSAAMPIMDLRTQSAERAERLPLPEPPLSNSLPAFEARSDPVNEAGTANPAVAANREDATDRPDSANQVDTANRAGSVEHTGPIPGRAYQVGPNLYRGAITHAPLPEQTQEEESGQAESVNDTPVVPPVLTSDNLQSLESSPEQPAAHSRASAAGPGFAEMMQNLHKLIGNRDYDHALVLAEGLLNKNDLDGEQREELLHIRAEMLFAVHRDNFGGFYLPIADATAQAINFNLRSPRNAAAFLRLGYMNLKLNNQPEAEANFNMLRRLFPDDGNVPLSYYYQGEHYFVKNELQKAADEFQYILQKYPNSPYALEAALGLARSFYRLGYFEQAFTIVDYIEKRWERFYLDYPPFLNMMGDVAYRLNKPEDALRHYWLYINLMPEGEEADIVLTRIGDIYSGQRETRAAAEMYRESIRRFPEKDGALVAMMRLAEQGINDTPSIAGMNVIFDGPFSLEPVKVYKSIISDHPRSGLVPLARIKLAMWHLWKREYTTALDEVTNFIQRYPDHELAPRAKEIAMQAFAVLASESVAGGNYNRMHEIWERYPIVHGQAEALGPESRIALGLSYWKDNRPNEALETLAPFFLGKKAPEYSEMALNLVLSIYLEFDQWQAVLDIARKVDLWELKPENSQQLDYAVALAHENLNQTDRAGPIWQKLYDADKLPPAQKAYASFFLARHAEKERQLEKAYMLGRESLSKLLLQVESSNDTADISKIKSQLASLMDIAETAGRLREALNYAEQYLQYLPEDEAEKTTVRYRMARIYKKQGSLDSWKKILTDIAAKNPESVYGQIAASELRATAIAEEAARFSPTDGI